MKLINILKFIITAIVILITFVLYSNVAVYMSGKSGVHAVSGSPEADAAIVLGARVYKNGGLSPVLADRLDTGIELYTEGKVKKLLLTGDHGQASYDEVNNMRLYALEQGVPETDIFMDHAGFSTYESMYRARDIFQVKKAIIVTQDFHLPRALYVAQALGLHASGVSADKREYIGEDYLRLREILANTKAVLQLLVHDKPTYLGPEIPIWGDGRVTKDI
ncbi:SanA/YdcF family protein [Phosphitispora sp. TUW77]|uniref:SanA/YdcF family protein n=1 Tax=Phosphitispora sp. TUW77 TaxID=3152361 RepID=UPI003AB650AA